MELMTVKAKTKKRDMEVTTTTKKKRDMEATTRLFEKVENMCLNTFIVVHATYSKYVIDGQGADQTRTAGTNSLRML
eukprot:scaffold661134_cov59-Attheya_sp.AAC.2